MNSTPNLRSRAGNTAGPSSASTATLPTVSGTPRVAKSGSAAPPPSKKSSRRNEKIVEERSDQEESEDELTQEFDGGKTTKNIAAQIAAVKRKYGDLFVERDEFEKEKKKMKKEFEALLMEALTTMQENIDDRFVEIEDALRAMNKVNCVRGVAAVADGPCGDELWTLDAVASCLAEKKVISLKGGHANTSTLNDVVFDVSDLLLGVCLHCLHAGRSPEKCVFLKGKQSTKMHRRPAPDANSTPSCVKAGYINDKATTFNKVRMILGKDYLTVRFPVYAEDFILKARNNTKPNTTMTVQEVDEHKKEKQITMGPRWYIEGKVKNTTEPRAQVIQGDEDFRGMLLRKWESVNLENQVTLDMDEWVNADGSIEATEAEEALEKLVSKTYNPDAVYTIKVS